jgi:hypothetical protein
MRIPLSADFRTRFTISIVALFFLTGMGMSAKLWTADHFFPLFPIHPSLAGLPAIVTIACAVILSATLLILFIKHHPVICATAIISYFVLSMLDQNRLQPWAYFYCLMLTATIFCTRHSSSSRFAISNLQLIIVALYTWSGIQKLNSYFLTDVFIVLLQKLFHISDPNTVEKIAPLGYLIPLIEISTGFGLYFIATRQVAIFAAILSHLIILLTLFADLKANPIVIPWNIAMMAIVPLLFYRNSEPIRPFTGADFSQRILSSTIVVLVTVLPFLSFLGWWDSYLSFNLYSGKPRELSIAVSDAQFSKLDQRFSKYLLKLPAGWREEK